MMRKWAGTAGRRLFVGAGVALVCALGVDSVAFDDVVAARQGPRVQRVSVLYVVSARSGTLVARPRHTRLFTLTLKHLEPRAVWFADRPVRRSGTFPSAGFAAAWKGFGFASEPPNAAVVYSRDRDGDFGDTVILELTRPRYGARSRTLSFTARWIDPTKVSSPNLKSHARAADATPPRTLTNPSLFIDDTSGQVINGCYIDSYADCPGADLAGADLSGANLFAAQLEYANLSGITATRTNLEAANLAHAELYQADLNSTNLTYAYLVDADLTHAFLLYADLQGANLSGAQLASAVFCHTTMPDGTINNAGC